MDILAIAFTLCKTTFYSLFSMKWTFDETDLIKVNAYYCYFRIEEDEDIERQCVEQIEQGALKDDKSCSIQ